MSLTNLRRIPVLLVFVGFLTACGGGGGGGGNPPGDTGDDGGGGGGGGDTYTVAGTVIGYLADFTLQNNSGDDLTITADGTFTFTTSVASLSSYSVTVSTQSAGQYCAVSNGSGTMGTADVTDVTVNCAGVSATSLYSAASNWNDYVNASDTTTACDGSETGGYSACIHGGEMRSVEVPGYGSCAGLTATDALGAFDWTCVESSTVNMVSTGLKEITPVTGTADDTSPGKLVNSAATFVTDGVELGDTVINTTDYTTTTVVSVDSENQLTLADDTFVSGDSYYINMDKNLSDLLDFATPGWKSNSVMVKNGGTTLFTTPSTAWWSNTVLASSGGDLTDVGSDGIGEIYVVTYVLESDPSDFYPLYTIVDDKIGLVVKPGVTLTGNAGTANENIIFATSQNFLWIEGKIDATGDNTGVLWMTVKFSVLRNLDASNAESGTYHNGVRLYRSSNNSLSNITASNNALAGVVLANSSNNNSLSNITASNNGNYGVVLAGSSDDNTLSNVIAANNGASGVYLNASSNDNTLSNITAANNDSGVYLASSSNNSLSNVTASNNAVYGVVIDDFANNNSLSDITASNNGVDGVKLSWSADNSLRNIVTANNGEHGVHHGVFSNNNSLSYITAANNGDHGVYIDSSSRNSLSNVTASNNGGGGVSLSWSQDNSLRNIVTANNGYGVTLNNFSSHNYFTGLLKVGSNGTADCYVDEESTSGDLKDDTGGVDSTHDGLCLTAGSSDFTLTTGVTLASSFVGKVGTDGLVDTAEDSANPEDDATPGTASYPADPATFDWTSFDNSYRGWGRDGGAFPASGNRGRWTTDTGRIWDWSMAAADTVIRDVLSLPTGDNTTTHTWFDSSYTTYLRNAVEIMGTGGNDNGLCETDETCLFTPNIGSYQGHGALVPAGTIGAGGTVENITLLEYTTKGY